MVTKVSKPIKGLSAEKRGEQLMSTKMGKLPILAYLYMRHLCSQIGGCAEVMFTAYVHYAICVEGYKAKDSAYAATDDAKNWFKYHEGL